MKEHCPFLVLAEPYSLKVLASLHPAYFNQMKKHCPFLVLPEPNSLEEVTPPIPYWVKIDELGPKCELKMPSPLTSPNQILKGFSDNKETEPVCYAPLDLRVIGITTWYLTTEVFVTTDSGKGRGGSSGRLGGPDGGAVPDIVWVSDPTAPHIGKTGGSMFGFSFSQDSIGGQGESSGGQEVVSGAANAGGGSEGSTGSGGGEENNEGMVGGGVGDQGNGDDGRDDRGRRRGGDVEDGRRPRKSRAARMAEIFIMVIAQTAAAVIGIYFLGLSSRGRGLLISALGTNLFGFMSCMAALWQNDINPHAADIWANIGSVAGALGFILMIAMVLPPYLLWMIIMACIGLLAIVVFTFMS